MCVFVIWVLYNFIVFLKAAPLPYVSLCIKIYNIPFIIESVICLSFPNLHCRLCKLKYTLNKWFHKNLRNGIRELICVSLCCVALQMDKRFRDHLLSQSQVWYWLSSTATSGRIISSCHFTVILHLWGKKN